ncbi:DUF5723 family protein [Alkalitalea saponilacus]|uniref:DUF5723 domain-containing protein n=1 Tax=Alkalitalea saponilacus TaxID=889453 RepID=A0A1T5F865_9BACT|nr:DUF5723 family protein [Alkalitalea saponilacus]ASB50140.1 flagellar motor protein MotB [Alkalitalea saponilacus]SKB92372.1 hypothetical protein SAMN03080601_01516 [Alkalitalea saponilacus]
MSFRKKIYIITLVFIVSTTVKAQSPMGLYFMETIPQSSHINPAMQPRANAYVSLPSLNLMMQSDVAFSTILQRHGGEYLSPISSRFDYDKLYRQIGKSTTINFYQDIDLLGLGFRYGRDYFSLNVGFRNGIQFGLPSDLFKIPENGFPDGQRLDLSTMRIKSFSYKELNFGYSREWNEYLTVGINIKPLFGHAAALTDISTFIVESNRTHWDLIVDGTVYSSAPIEVEESDTPGDFPESIDGKDLDGDDFLKYLTGFNNPGIAFDFGAVYKLSDDWTFSAAFHNLGFITWKHDINTLSFNGKYTFDGVEIDGDNKDDWEEAFEAIGDSIKSIIDYQVGHGSFRTPLTPGMYLGAQYNLTHYLSFGLLSRSLFQKYNFTQDFNLSANVQPLTFVAFNMNYSYRINGGNGLGAGFTILGGPLQFYMMADYIPTKYADVYIDDNDPFMMFPNQRDLSIRFGLNLIFGRHGYRDRPMVNLY